MYGATYSTESDHKMEWAKKYFQIEERGSSVAQEVRGGTATFLTMSYILLVNPQVLAKIGIPATDAGSVFLRHFKFLFPKFNRVVVLRSDCHGIIKRGWMLGCWVAGVSEFYLLTIDSKYVQESSFRTESWNWSICLCCLWTCS